MKKLRNESNIAIQLLSVSKKYEIHHEKPTFVEQFVKGRNEIFWALKEVDLTIRTGEKVGIIGPNGSGKTTLLKIIAGIASPTSGSVQTHGKVVSLIDVEAGFHSDLTGIQNIYLSGLLLGMSKRELDEKLHDIILFADIKQFIDAPFYTYSQGMMLRLGFAVVVHADPDILILDEAIGAGDQEFQKKSKRKIQDFFRRNKTIIVVSHWLDFLQKNCNRVIIIESGKIRHDGGVEVLRIYKKNHPI